MKLSVKYQNNGILFSILDTPHSTFPLDQSVRHAVNTEDWEKLNAAEQLWYDGLLEYQEESQNYLLPTQSYFFLDDECKTALQLPPESAKLHMTEIGNIGRHDYKIEWDLLINSRPGGRKTRAGNIVTCAGRTYALNESQFQLVEWIDSGPASDQKETRARYQAKAVFLAKRAGVTLERFTKQREFHFSEDADYTLSSPSAQEIKFSPILPDLPASVRDNMPSKLSPVTHFLGTDKKQTTVFVSDRAREKYNQIAQFPELRGTQVPQFLDDPVSILPENFDFHADEFAERVKGLKIRTSTAVPYVNIDPDPNKPGWFNVDTGLTLRNTKDPDAPDTPCNSPELLALMEQAGSAGEKYVYYQDQWVKIPENLVSNFRRAEKELMDRCGRSASEAQLRLILDIYDNLNGVEYNEDLLAFRKLSEEDILAYRIPECFQGSLFPYQSDGYGFMRAHYETNTGVLLADDMGLGKTVQIIAFLSHLFSIDHLSTALLVMPKSLIENWHRELSKFLPAARRIYIHQGSSRYRFHEAVSQYDIVLTTYQTLARDQAMLGRIQWSCVICDEVQMIKNFKTVTANAVKGMNTKCRIAVTGTPVENRLSELWSIADFAQPGLLDSYQKFWKTFEKPISTGQDTNGELTNLLIQTLSPIFLRRTKEDVLADKLPVKQEHSIQLGMDCATKGLYQSIIDEVTNSDEQGMVLSAIQKLLMLCSHPRLVTGVGDILPSTPNLIRESPKLQWAVEILREIFRNGEKVILFTKFKRMQSILRRVILDEFGIDAEIINGEVTGNRLDVVKRFSDISGAGALILSPRAAGVGLTITAANHVIHYTREWNPAVENQATDRVYRIGQEKPVSVYYPILTAADFLCADEKLDQLLTSKRNLMQRVIIPADLTIRLNEFGDVLSVKVPDPS